MGLMENDKINALHNSQFTVVNGRIVNLDYCVLGVDPF